MNTIRKAGHTIDIRSEKGMALMMSLFLITVLTVLGVMVINTAIVETKVATNQKINSQVFYAAEAGLDRGLKILEQELQNNTTDPWGDTNIEAPDFAVTAVTLSGSIPMDRNVRSMDMYLNATFASGVKRLTFTNGGNTVGRASYDLYMYSPNPAEVYLLSHAQSPDGAAAVEYHLRTTNDAPFANAVFSESGVTINNKNANATDREMTIAGSIYTRGKLTIAAGQRITNNYTDADIPPELASIIPNVDDLATRIRVYGGHLNLANDVIVGTDSIDPPGSVAKIETDMGITGPGRNLYHADEVGNEPADLKLPTILEALEDDYAGVSTHADYAGISDETKRAMAIYKDIIRGQGPFAPGAQYAKPGATITSKGVVIDDNIISGCEKWVLDEDGGRQAENGEIDLDGTNPPFECLDALGNGVKYDPTTTPPTFTVIGMVMCDDEFEIDTEIQYVAMGPFEDDGTGNPVAPENQLETGASVIVGRSIEFNNTFMPANGAGYCAGGGNTNSIGFVSGSTIDFTATAEGVEGGNPGNSDALPVVTGYFYTPGTLSIQDQIQVAGAFMASKFGLSGDVGVYQVPDLINYIPPMMPGDEMDIAFRDREWRRVF